MEEIKRIIRYDSSYNYVAKIDEMGDFTENNITKLYLKKR